MLHGLRRIKCLFFLNPSLLVVFTASTCLNPLDSSHAIGLSFAIVRTMRLEWWKHDGGWRAYDRCCQNDLVQRFAELPFVPPPTLSSPPLSLSGFLQTRQKDRQTDRQTVDVKVTVFSYQLTKPKLCTITPENQGCSCLKSQLKVIKMYENIYSNIYIQ